MVKELPEGLPIIHSSSIVGYTPLQSIICAFPKMVVPLNHSFEHDFPL